MSCVDNHLQVNDALLENVTHEDAVAALKATQERVLLTIAKPSYMTDLPDTGAAPGGQ